MEYRGSFVRWSVACLLLAALATVAGNTAGEQRADRLENQLRSHGHQLADGILRQAEQGLSEVLLALERHSTDPRLRQAVRRFEQSGDYRAQLQIRESLQTLQDTLPWAGDIDVRDRAGLVIAGTSDTRIGSERPDFNWSQPLETWQGARLGFVESRLHVQFPLQHGSRTFGMLEYRVSPQVFQSAIEGGLAGSTTAGGVRAQLMLDGDTGTHRLVRKRVGDSSLWLDGALPATASSSTLPLSVQVRMARQEAVQAASEFRDAGFIAGMVLMAASVLFMLLHALAPYFQGMQLLRHVRPKSTVEGEEIEVPESTGRDERHSPSERMAYDILATHHVLEEVLKEHTGELEKLYRVLNKEHRKRDEAEAALKAAELRFHEAVESCMEGVWEWNAEQGLRTWISESFLVTLGLRRSEFSGAFQDFLAVMHEDDRNPCFAAFQQQVRYGSHFEVEYRLRNRTGEWHWFLSRGQVIRKNGQVLRVMGSIQDIQSRKRAELEVEHLVRELENRAHRDGLTGLHNRTSFLELAGTELKRADRSTQPLSLMMLDLDHFKRINDEHGHAVGDQVLREFASALREELRESDTCARIGGEEFMVLLPETSNLQACRLADRLRQRVGQRRIRIDGGRNVQFTCSVGVTRLLPGETLETLMGRADDLMYQSKHAGRNRVSSDCGDWQTLNTVDA